MHLRLAIAVLLVSVTAAQAQRGAQTSAGAMAARAANTGNQALNAAAGTPGLYDAPSLQSGPPPDTQKRVTRSQVTGTPSDPQLRYPYGRYEPTLGNVSPDSLGNPYLANPAAIQPTPPPVFKPPER